MKRKNNLSNNLKAVQRARHITQAEFAREMDIPKSTLQTVMLDGNTSLDTLIHIANALNMSLDELVFGEKQAVKEQLVEALFQQMSWYADWPPEWKEAALYHISCLLKILTREEVFEIIDTINDVRRKHGCDL